jgi:NAD(P)-dependent dehydrogenase (short-subunit alcohol dehydrogenase family)
MTRIAQIAIARGVAEPVVGNGITVNSVLRGPTESEGGAQFVADLVRRRGVDLSVVEAEFFRTARPPSFLRRFAGVEEVANMIVCVCSPLASATSGAALRVDGGVVRAIG